jgi:hydrogenase maturation protease
MSLQQSLREAYEYTETQYPNHPFSSSSRTIVLALGNPLRGDDGVGQVVLEALMEVENLPANVTLQDGSGGVLLNLLLTQPRQRVIIVDAGNIGRKPGEWIQCSLREIRFTQEIWRSNHTLHNAGLGDFFTLGEALGISLPAVTIYCVQPKNLGYSLNLSEEVMEAVPEVYGAIMTDLYMDQELEKRSSCIRDRCKP